MLCGGKPVMLQAMKEEPPPPAKCKDKFLIQSTTITPEKETLTLSDIVSSSSLPFACKPSSEFYLLVWAQRFCLRDDDLVELYRW